MVKAAVGNSKSRKEVIVLFKQRGDEVKVIKEVVKAIAGNSSGKEVIVLLLK